MICRSHHKRLGKHFTIDLPLVKHSLLLINNKSPLYQQCPETKLIVTGSLAQNEKQTGELW